jgi:Flp pilus assembly protein TadG
MSIFRYVRSKRGQSVVEFTLAAPLFFVAFYAIVEFSHLFYVRVAVQHALDEAGRYMSTGQGQSLTDANARLTRSKTFLH